MYQKYLTLLNLLYEMQASNDGISYKYIENRYDVSRRTAERMMKAIIESNPDVEVVQNRPKRWRIREVINAPSPTLEQLSMLSTAVKMFERDGNQELSADAYQLYKYLKVNMDHGRLTRLDADLEALEDAQAFSHRPGPMQTFAPDVLVNLRNAIKGSNKVSFDYTSAKGKTHRWFKVHPYGFVHGNNTRSYLVAFCDSPRINDLRLFTLTNITKLEIYEDEFFERDEERSVERYLEDCFGVYKENRTYNVVWRFNAEAADTVQQWVFHPTQTLKQLRDGRIEVRFKACGLREMAWHAATWGEMIEVVRPKKLIDVLREVKNSIRVPD